MGREATRLLPLDRPEIARTPDNTFLYFMMSIYTVSDSTPIIAPRAPTASSIRARGHAWRKMRLQRNIWRVTALTVSQMSAVNGLAMIIGDGAEKMECQAFVEPITVETLPCNGVPLGGAPSYQVERYKDMKKQRHERRTSDEPGHYVMLGVRRLC